MYTKWFAVILALLPLATFLRAEDASKKLVISKDEQTILDDTNAERKKAGLSALKPNAQLFAAARGHSTNMAKENKMEHQLLGKGPAERIAATGYKAMAGRENIAFQYTVSEVVANWMQSEHHRDNILADDIGEIGVGIANDTEGHPYYTQVFGLSEKNAVTLRFTFKNISKKPLTLNLGGEPLTVKPNESGAYTLIAALATPSITITSEELTKTVKVKAGARVTADVKNGAIEVQGDTR